MAYIEFGISNFMNIYVGFKIEGKFLNTGQL
jgi:hypothetical protein